LLAIIPSIAFYRATVQPEYKWGMLAIHGKGTSSDYWILLIAMLSAWATFVLGAWYKRKWYYAFPVILFSVIAGVLVYGYFNQQQMLFQGDVWKFKFEIRLLMVVISVVLLIASIVWAIMDVKDFRESNFRATIFQKKTIGDCFVFEWHYLFIIWAGKRRCSHST
jgi:hypothetical protein